MTPAFEGNNSIICNWDGKVLYFGITQFINKIVKEDCCFICGDAPGSKEFNNEHVIPDWLLRKHNLHSKTITLPNGTRIPYGMYTTPCCKECNSELGRVIETPISQLLGKCYDEIVNDIHRDKTLVHKLFHWLCLLYIKTHLKDNSLLLNRDRRQNSGNIGDNYDWEEMHHIHCMARQHYTNAIIQKNVYGTIAVVPSIILEKGNTFDYADHTASKTIMVQSGDFCIIAVLNDSCACLSVYEEFYKKISGALSPFQIRDLMSHFNFINLNLEERPKYFSGFTENSEYTIGAIVPEYFYLESAENRISSPGELLHFYTSNLLGNIPNRDVILEEIREGKRNYLFDESGNFINHNN